MIWALAFAGGLLTLALLAKPTQAQGKGASSEHVPVGFTLDATACAGELIELTGTLHTVNHFRLRKDGSYHVNSHYNLHNTKGVGLTTGEQYVVPSAGNTVENRVHSGQTVTGAVDITMVIGKGQIPNQNAFSRVHYIITPEGEVKTENVQFHFKCQPGNTSPTATASATAAASVADTKASPTATKASPTATSSPGTGGAPLAMGAAGLLVGSGLAARRLF